MADTKREILELSIKLQTRAVEIRNTASRQFHCYNESGEGLKGGQKKWFKQAMKNAYELDRAAAALMHCFNRLVD
jgi:hypothetical protein